MQFLHMLSRSAVEFVEDAGMTMSAAMAYYAIFSLPPMLMIVTAIAGSVVDAQAASQALTAQTGALIGPEAAAQVRRMIESVQFGRSGNVTMMALSASALFVGATTMFTHLQYALNAMWRVEPEAGSGVWGVVRRMMLTRIFSFGMILVVGLLLLISLIVTTVITAIGHGLSDLLPAFLSQTVVNATDTAVSLVVVTVLFAAVFRIVPDVDLRWGDVWAGACLTAVLFVIGKSLIGIYLGRTDLGSMFGAAGSLAVILIWIYYTAIILFFGAKFTQVYVQNRRPEVRPAAGARWID